MNEHQKFNEELMLLKGVYGNDVNNYDGNNGGKYEGYNDENNYGNNVAQVGNARIMDNDVVRQVSHASVMADVPVGQFVYGYPSSNAVSSTKSRGSNSRSSKSRSSSRFSRNTEFRRDESIEIIADGFI